ncbi:MAG: flagellar hook protein FlgE [Gammaproteobacteria bacterium]
MSFNIALSGLNAASSDLSVTSNNIANVGTIGFKESRAEFADIYAASPLGTTANAIGGGVALASVSQQFGQGNLEFTENTLDIAVSGEGFYIMRQNQSSNDLTFTRAGAFQVDQNGFIVNSAGQLLQVFPVDTTGAATTTSLTGTVPLQVPNNIGTPQASSTVNINMNLPAGITPAIAVAGLDADLAVPQTPNPNNYHHSTSATVFDSQGNSHIMTMYFVMTNDLNNTWDVRATLDGITMVSTNAAAAEQLDFDAAGTLDGTNSTDAGAIVYDPVDPLNGAAQMNITIDYRSQGNNLTQEAQGDFFIQSLSQDGFSTGRLSGIEIDDEGLVRASFTNGQITPLGKIALVRFDNPQGLKQTGDTAWVETTESGAAVAGEAGTGNFGLLQTGALETSNVDLTAELVKLITAQRNFQANSKSIETANAITQTVINIR